MKNKEEILNILNNKNIREVQQYFPDKKTNKLELLSTLKCWKLFHLDDNTNPIRIIAEEYPYHFNSSVGQLVEWAIINKHLDILNKIPDNHLKFEKFFYLSCEHGFLPIVEFFFQKITNGLNVLLPIDLMIENATSIAIKNGHIDIFDYFMTNNSQLFSKHRIVNIAFITACRYEHKKIINDFLKTQNKLSLGNAIICLAEVNPSSSIINNLIDEYFNNPNEKDNEFILKGIIKNRNKNLCRKFYSDLVNKNLINSRFISKIVIYSIKNDSIKTIQSILKSRPFSSTDALLKIYKELFSMMESVKRMAKINSKDIQIELKYTQSIKSSIDYLTKIHLINPIVATSLLHLSIRKNNLSIVKKLIHNNSLNAKAKVTIDIWNYVEHKKTCEFFLEKMKTPITKKAMWDLYIKSIKNNNLELIKYLTYNKIQPLNIKARNLEALKLSTDEKIIDFFVNEYKIILSKKEIHELIINDLFTKKITTRDLFNQLNTKLNANLNKKIPTKVARRIKI